MLFRSTLTKELFITSISTILILSGVVLAQRAVYIFRLASRGIIPNDTIETVLVFNLLKHMPLLLSLTIFLTILITLSRLYRDSEMIIWFSSGISLKRFMPPILNFCFPVIILIGVLSLFISPWAIQKAEEYKNGLKNRDETSTLLPGAFKESKSNNRVFYIEGLDEFGKKVKNIFVQTNDDKKIGVLVSKEGKRETKSGGAEYIVLSEGKRYESIKDANEFTSTTFQEYGILIEKEASKIIDVGASAGLYEAIPTFDLILILGNNQITKQKYDVPDNLKKSKYIAELLLRISQPISSLVLIFIAISLSYVNPRVGRSYNIISAILIFIIYHNLIGISHSLVGTERIDFLLGYWPIHLLFIFLAFFMIKKRVANRPITKIFNN
jgi:lipopolysaccharide export system permease protein